MEPISFIPAKRRRRHKRRVVSSPPAPPVAGPQVVSVSHADDDTQMRVVLSADLQAVEGFDQAMRVFIPGLYWVGSTAVDYVDARNVVVTFSESVAAATEWMTPFPEVWEFVSGEAMDAPFSGEVG